MARNQRYSIARSDLDVAVFVRRAVGFAVEQEIRLISGVDKTVYGMPSQAGEFAA
jgi:hypothetical protein